MFFRWPWDGAATLLGPSGRPLATSPAVQGAARDYGGGGAQTAAQGRKGCRRAGRAGTLHHGRLARYMDRAARWLRHTAPATATGSHGGRGTVVRAEANPAGGGPVGARDNPMTKALGQPAAARLNEKLRKCTDGATSYANTRLVDLSNVLEGPPPEMIVSARYRIAPGKMQEFENLVKSDILPVYKKAKTGLTVSRRGVGANPNDVTMSTVYSKFADLDGGTFLVKQLGQAGADRVNAKFVGIRTLIEVLVRRRVQDLSF